MKPKQWLGFALVVWPFIAILVACVAAGMWYIPVILFGLVLTWCSMFYGMKLMEAK